MLVNGAPAKGIAVTFQNLDKNASGNAAHPAAVTDDLGKFELSTNAEKDGAVEGEYAILFFWPSGSGPTVTDRLSGRFNSPDRSKLRVKVEPKEMDLEPFRLEIDPKLIRPAGESKDVTQ